jgi:hypothetical protein
MPHGSLDLLITDTQGQPLTGDLSVDFDPASNSTGGTGMDARFTLDGQTRVVVEQLNCRGGTGTLYAVRLSSPRYRPYSFFQRILPDRVNPAADSPVRLVVRHDEIAGIEAPRFDRLKRPLQRFLAQAAMQKVRAEDADLVGLRGSRLYDGLGALRQACLLNLFAKASHESTDRCWRFVEHPVVLRQDRCFCTVSAGMRDALLRSPRFRSVSGSLHDALEGYEILESLKSRDAHANLQVTLMRHRRSGEWAADIDIDEASGIRHGFEVIRNRVTSGRTNPYLVRELLLLADPIELSLDPGYRFSFVEAVREIVRRMTRGARAGATKRGSRRRRRGK